MTKVGILSMQRIANYGSFLQAYGLKCILEELGCNVQFVDYHPKDTLILADSGTGMRRKISKTIDVLKHKGPLKEKIRFIKYKKNYAVNYYPYLEINNQMNFNPVLDLLIIGSDEVFNCIQSNTNVGFSSELFGEGNNAKRLITYAASFGNTTVEKLRKYKVTDEVAGWLKKFDAISVRDNNSKKVIESITGIVPKYHLDPVLIYDFVKKCVNIPVNVPEKKYMIIYGYSGRFSKEECKRIKEYAKKRELKIFCIGGVQEICDKFIDCDPFYVIAYFQNAECIITDTFHGTIISIITHKQFVSIVRKSEYGNFEKLTDLLLRLKLTSRVVKDIELIPKMLEEKIDFKIVDNIIKEERERSYEYLKKEVEICIQN